ncbi:porin family protein [Mangrovimonas sp. CR14]|uniref:porin family protein n=1 Tax=Mangrovimonas sp. CR14 TaxID=2706120 RepID=UPI0014237F21|nr:porin family protein [Mangrovimonas sp. CR14]NIK90896.1 porin family protein [Mangrovimonas sp. CR14]
MPKILLVLQFLLLSAKFYSQELQTSNDSFKNKGFYNITRSSIIKPIKIIQIQNIEGLGTIESNPSTNRAFSYSIETITGYFLTPYFSLGLGFGFDGYQNPTFNTLPVFLDLRLYGTDDENSPYIYGNIGPSINLGGGESPTFKKGMIFNFGLGYKFNVRDSLFLVTDVFYSHKNVSLTKEWLDKSPNTIKINGIGLSVGAIF